MSGIYRMPVHFYLGVLLLSISWYLNWDLSGLRTHYLFFPLWLGYSLIIDGITFKRKGSSLLTRNWRKYVFFFLMSIPVWWIFEGLNLRTQNWHYLGREYFTDLEYFLYASLCFSTVIPAVFGSAELVASFSWVKNLKKGPRIPSNNTGLAVLFVIGIASLVLLLVWPKYFYVFLWLSVFFILDTLNHLNGHRSLVSSTDKRDWRPLVSLALGCLICGFFWEMWNYYAYPKWIYHTPGVEFLYVFEMPILGYLGYIPFSFELFAFYYLFIPGKKSSHQSHYFLNDF
jgi:hypothetical protein